MKSPRARRDVDALLRSLSGATIPGDCEHCNAEQRMTEVSDGVFSLQIMHDDDCPEWLRIQRATSP